MLCLGRRVGEKIVIAGTITVTVLESRDGRVKIGVEAPRAVSIDRAENLPPDYFTRPLRLPTDPQPESP